MLDVSREFHIGACRLYIVLLAAKSRYKIHFKVDASPLPVLIRLLYLHHSNIDTITTDNQFIVNDVFHDMRFLLLAHIKNGIS